MFQTRTYIGLSNALQRCARRIFCIFRKTPNYEDPNLTPFIFSQFSVFFNQQLVRKGFHFYLDEAPLDKTELKQLFANEPETLRLFQKAENKNVGFAIGFAWKCHDWL